MWGNFKDIEVIFILSLNQILENYKEGNPVYNIQIDSKETATYMMGLENKITKFMKGQKL